MIGKKIIVGVCGSIAAYKVALLVRLLKKEHCEVKVIMTEDAKSFITPLTLSTLSKNPVASSFIKNDQGEWQNHVDLGLWADHIIIAPATANTLAKFANGICDNLLSAVYLSARCPVSIALAMDLDMYNHPSVAQNIKKLKDYGNHIIDAEYGELASGLVGDGRMAEPEHILKHLKTNQRLKNRKVLITAGPTQEAIDPVRFIGNHSTGKMGIALAEKAAQEGANVSLVLGSGCPIPKHPNISVVNVKSAQEMFDAVSEVYPSSDVAIFSAAVADYRPKTEAKEKIKKEAAIFSIELIKNIDIALEMGKIKTENQINVGFALETENELNHAITKLKKKNFDFVVLNSLKDEGAGFAHSTNKISIIHKDLSSVSFDKKSKTLVAEDIINTLCEKYIHS